MVFVTPKDRVLELSTSNSQTVFDVTGAIDGSYRAFFDVMSVGDTTIGGIVEPGAAFSSGVLTYSAANQVTISTILESNGTFSATGTKQVFIGQPATGDYNVAYGAQIVFEGNGLNPNHGPFVISGADNGDPDLYVGYNIVPATWGFINSGDPRAVFFGQEADYDDGSGHNKMEQYWQYQLTAGFGPDGSGNATYRRTIMAQYDKVTNLPTALFLSSGPANGIIFGINDGTGRADQEQVVGKIKAQVTVPLFTVYNQPGGATTGLVIDSTVSSAATGITVNSLPAGSGVGVAATSSGGNETLYLDGKGGGSIVLGAASTGLIELVRPVFVADTTASFSPATGSLRIGGGVGAAGDGYFGGKVSTNSLSVPAMNATPAVFGGAAVTIAAGGSAPILTGTAGFGMIRECTTTGDFCVFVINNGGLVILSQTAANFSHTSTPASGKFGIAYDVGTSTYRLYNGAGASRTFSGPIIQFS